MRKTNEGLSILTALEKAELKLSEAIEMARFESKGHKPHDKNGAQVATDNFKEKIDSDSNNEGKDTLQNTDGDFKQNVEVEKSIDKKFDVVGTSDSDSANQPPKKSSKGVQAFLDISFDELDFSDKSILSQSEEYEIQSFDEIDVHTGQVMEVDDIMPSSFMLESFSDEYQEIGPYGINKELLLGKDVFEAEEQNKTSFVADLLEKAQAEAEAVSILDHQSEAERNGEFKKKSIAIVQQAKNEANKILEVANAEAQDKAKQAEVEAQRIIEEKVGAAEEVAAAKGYTAGFEKGQNQGYIEAMESTNQQMIEEAKAFKLELEQTLQDFEERKIQLLEDNLNDLTNLSLTVAEKIIKISLKSSKDVIAKMIVAAAEDCRNKEWAKVYISNEDKALAMNLEKELIDVLKQISPNIRVVVMEDEPPGTCIIETPDQIIDASVNVQLDAIKQIVNDNEL